MVDQALLAGGAGDATSQRQADAPSASCPVGAYYGRAEDSTEFSFTVAGDGRVSQIKAQASRNGLTYEVDFPDSTRDAGGFFRTQHPGIETLFGRGPSAELDGQCVESDRYALTINDRAGTRSASIPRVLLEPGLYEGSVWTGDTGTKTWSMVDETRGDIRFRIHPDGTVDNPVIHTNPRYWGPQRVWTDAPELVDPGTGRNARLGADRCGFGFSAFREVRGFGFYYEPPPSGRVRLETTATCTRGNRVAGELINPKNYMTSPWHPPVLFEHFAEKAEHIRWEARRVGD